MYEAFDKFLSNDTWHTSHALDDERFYRVRCRAFIPEPHRPYTNLMSGTTLGNKVSSRANREAIF